MAVKVYKELEVLIDNSGLKLGYISEQMGISRQRLLEIRKNPSSMSIDQMENLAQLLNVDFMDIYDIHKNFRKNVDKNAT